MKPEKNILDLVPPPNLWDLLVRAISPPPKLTVSEWADKNRILSGKSAAEPGRWRTSRAPYTKEPMDCISDPAVGKVTLMWGSQLGKTEVLLNAAGYFIDCDPAPILLVEPTLPMARAYSQDRIAPMLRDCPALAAKVPKAKSRDAGNTTLHKDFPGGHLTLVGAQSATDLSGRPIRVLLGDETDRPDDTAEGDPFSLAETRTKNFWNRVLVWASSPRDKETSRIEASFLSGDQRHWHVPCPHCGNEQVLDFTNVTWDKVLGDDGKPIQDDDGHAVHLPGTARYACESCGALWTDAERHAAVLKGRWVAHAPEIKGHASFWLSGLYSPWASLSGIVSEFLKVRHTPGKLRVFVNTVLCQSWEEQGARLEEDELLKRCEDYRLPPAAGLIATAGTDTQDDRLEVEIVVWGRWEESWQARYIVIPGDPNLPQVWKELDKILMQPVELADGRLLTIRAAGIDTGGHHADKVYQFTRARWRRRVWAFKGAPRGVGVPVWPGRISRSKKSRDKLYVVNVDQAKKTVVDYLAIEAPGPGYCHFPKERDRHYFQQFAAEELITKYDKRGFSKKVWIKRPGKRNEALDLRGYNYAVLQGLYASGLNLELEHNQAMQAAKNKNQAAPAPAPVNAPPSGGYHPGQGGGGLSVPAADPYLS